MNIELTKVEKIKSHLILQFEGSCAVGSLGNDTVDFIIACSRKEILKAKDIQGLILDFSKMRYEFGNRFAYLLAANKYIPNRQLYIRIIPHEADVKNWDSLIQIFLSSANVPFIQKDYYMAIQSINREMSS